MKSNNLDTMEKNLRSIAKRYENVKYSIGLAVLFLMKGTSAFSNDNHVQEIEKQKDIFTDVKKEKSEIKEKKSVKQANQKLKASWANMQFGANDMYSNYFFTPKAKVDKDSIVKSEKTVLLASTDNTNTLPIFAKLLTDIEETTETRTQVPTTAEIKASKDNLRNSVGNLQNKINSARQENNKEIEGLKLELTQLMEQGDQVVKSPWSSWQFGANYMYNEWGGTYKGRGDKAEKYAFEGIFTRSLNSFERVVSPLSEKYDQLEFSTNKYSALTSARKDLSSGYGLTSVERKQEPLVSIEINAAVKPKTIQKEALRLSIPGINAPNVPIPTVNPSTPINLELPEPNTPSKVVVIAKPNAEPFTGYYFDGTWSHRELRDNISIYSGIDPTSLIGNINNTNPTPAAMTGSYNGRQLEGTRIRNEDNRYTNTYYLNSQTNIDKIANSTFYLRGHYSTDTYNDSNTRAHLGISNNAQRVYNDGHGNGIPDEGVVGVHALGDLNIKNIVFNLYGRAGAVTNETWRHGILDFDNVTVNMYNSDNMGFYNMPVARYTYKYGKNVGGIGREWRVLAGGFSGKANVNMYGRNNSVYLTTGLSYMKHWQNEGLIQSDGASNIVYSSFSYAPTLSKLVNPAGAGYLHNTNMIKLSNVKLYGDENIGMYFGSRIKGDIAKVHMEAPNEIESLYGYNNKAAHIGLYQGEIDFSAKIGEKLTIDNQNQQTAEGNLNNTGYTNETVDGAVGIFSESGQRVGIVARGDVMEGPTPTAAEISAHSTDPTWDRWFWHKWNSATQQIEINKTGYGAGFYYAASNDFSKDPIHNLEVAKLDIRFGKYSKNGIMVLAKQGTVIDVGKNTSNYHITGVSSDITDGINGANTLEADASTGTIVAYAEGTWDQLKHRYGSEDARIAQNDADAVAINNGAARKALTDTKATTAAKLQGLGSEININPNVVLASKEGIAYMGDNQGIVNAMGTTEAVNYGSIIAYAKNKGIVTVNGTVKAEDKNTVSEANKFKNIGAFAEAGGKAELKGAVTINGIGAFAKGAGSEAILSSTNNDVTINAGTVGGMVATDNGYAKLNGGTINVTKDNSRLFYADATGKIDFTRATNINVSKGIILPQEESNPAFYNSKVSTAAGVSPTKYNGMENVTINLLSDDVVLRTVDNHAPETWTGGANFETNVKNIMKYSALNKNGHTYKAYYTNGEFKIAVNINRDDATDIFNGLVMGNEKVTIDNGISITSNTGKGLAQAALKNTVDNSKTAYINNGTVNITGANSGSIALKVDHGTIENNGLVSMTDGIGLYGSSGSKISNNANGKISISSPSQHGIGIAGFLTGTSAQEYGTDKLISNLIATSGGNLPSTIKTIDITNDGEIEISGKAVGIYADNTSKIAGFNNHVTKENAVVNNNATLSFGDDSVGIYAKKAIVNLSGTGKDDISVGKKGIGVAAEDSTVNLLTDYGFQIKDNGIGLYAKNTDTSTGTMNVKYTGANVAGVIGTGAYFEMTGSPITNKLNINVENVPNTTEGMIGIYTKNGNFTNEGNVKITNTNTLGFGIISSGADVTNKGDITLEDSLNPTKPNIGMYTAGSDNLKNLGKITVGKNGIGIYAKNFSNGDSATLPNSTIEVGENGIGVYTEAGAGENIKLESGSIKAGKDGVGVYAVGNGGTIRATNTFNMTLGDGSSDADKGVFGFVNVGSNNKIYSDISNVSLQNNSIYIYSKDTSGTSTNPQIINNTNITATGKNNYGIYSAGYVVNNGNMNLSAGTGNVGVYSVNGGTIENRNGAITVGGSVPVNDEYGIGMAAGYTWTKKDLLKPVSQRPQETTGNIINRGTINVNGQYSLGMYASGNGSTAKNYGTISLNANNTTGMYLTDKAVGHNYGTITNAAGVKDVTGVVVKNGAKFINEATGVVSLNATNALGILRTKDEGETLGIIENYGTFNITGDGSEVEKVSESKDLNKSLGKGKDKISIDVPAGATTGTIKLNDIIQSPEIVETKKLELEETQVSTIGMYINTSGVKFTKPITGLSELSQLRKADLIIGAEAAQSTTAKYIQVGNSILKPYNDTILNNPQINKWTIYSGSLTWMANIGQNQVNGTIENAYLAKIPYPVFAKDKNTYNFTDGLEQRYGKEGIGSRENTLFQKLNSIGNNEDVLLFQAFDEMMGHQYANTQQRIQSTGSILDKEFNYLRNEWSNPSKDANKIKTFGAKGEYKTNTAGVIDYTNNAYGVAYVHEDETVRLGESTGWYAGIVHNTFRFKDIGNSKEEQLQGKVGIFKSVPFDHNNSLNWTVSGEIFAGHNKMHRKFLVVDEVFNAKGRYHTYGAAVKNEISKEFRLSEDFSLRPYASLKLEYGRVSKIREKSGEMRLDVKANDYFSVRPEIGTELAYRHYFGANTVKATVGVAYENELGRVANGKNKAKVAGTDADYFNIRGEKDDRTGNVKTDLNLGWDNQRVGVTANVGYDTKGHNVRVGVGLRVIF
ncbi:autotransporter-associated N-terminal domain-containing protein [Fusobacterium pseudoperiodonticum]|uniref:autotransporter-associated N-terminal domain-containing protein n=1 Tax=Fusobacterium pseudoperiodonticum TaxID=2663009 RepID=UPI000C1B8A0A|nr:autotransporter-associated N-terminal domain-containing protein [Fusobacterium pseudoperiodonticum]ATV68498.1 autotransporter domain-containing protein [Fusobacterium pseudoperiodonticum]